MSAREISAELRPLVDAAIAMARTRLESGEELTGIAFIDAPMAGGNAKGFVVVPMSSAPSKDAWRRMVTTVSSFTDARFVLLVSEVWIHETATKADLDRLLAEHKEVRLMPGRREAVLVQIETHDGLWQGEADVVPFAVSAKGGRTFGALELKMPAHSEGRVVGLLAPRQRGN